MFTTPTQFLEAQKSQLDAFNALSSIALDTTEKLVELNLASAKAALSESAETTQALLGVKDFQDLLTLNGGKLESNVDKVAGYNRNVYGIVSGAGAEVKGIVDVQIAQNQGKVVALVESAAKNAPAGAEPFVSLFKSAMSTSASAYDNLFKAAQQVVDAAEGNLQAAVEGQRDVVKAKSKKAA